MKVGRLVHIVVGLEAQVLRTYTHGIIAKNLVLVEEVRMEIPNILMMK